MTTAQDIIDEFDKLTDNMSELSTAQKLDLLNSKYQDVVNDRDWEWLRNTYEVTIENNQIAVPSGFRNFAENNKTKYRFGFWVGDSFYPIVNMQNRRTNTHMSYYDPSNGVIVLADGLSLNGQTASFDGFVIPNELNDLDDTINTFRSVYWKIISYLMATEHYLVDHTEKGRSQRDEYKELAQNILESMQYEDDQLKEDWLTH